MPWGTDDGGHYYISPVEKVAIRDDNAERRAERERRERAKVNACEYVYTSDHDAELKDQFCRCVCELEQKKNLQRAYAAGSRAYNDAAKQVSKVMAIYNSLLLRLQALYGGSIKTADKVITQSNSALTKQEKANIRNEISADLFFRLLSEIAPERKQGVIQMVDEALDAELRKRGVQVG